MRISNADLAVELEARAASVDPASCNGPDMMWADRAVYTEAARRLRVLDQLVLDHAEMGLQRIAEIRPSSGDAMMRLTRSGPYADGPPVALSKEASAILSRINTGIPFPLAEPGTAEYDTQVSALGELAREGLWPIVTPDSRSRVADNGVPGQPPCAATTIGPAERGRIRCALAAGHRGPHHVPGLCVWHE